MTNGSFYPEVVCWRITSSCNRKCKFCYRSGAKDVSTKDAKRIIDSLSRMKVRCLGITGGEPLCRPDISEILRYAKSKNFKICLATNADFFKRYRNDIFRFVDVVGLPIESLDSKVHDSLRGENNLFNVKEALKDVIKNSNIRFYITTVLTNKNRGELGKIEEFLSSIKERLVYWKIYEIVDYKDRKHQEINGLRTSSQRINVLNILNDKTFFLTAEDRSGSCLLLNPNGDMIVPKKKGRKTEDIIIGNALDDEHKEILSNWRRETDIEKYNCHLCALRLLP
jgi:MoaA/NifB/PqqE/SkfB family radical SAM enzyme